MNPNQGPRHPDRLVLFASVASANTTVYRSVLQISANMIEPLLQQKVSIFTSLYISILFICKNLKLSNLYSLSVIQLVFCSNFSQQPFVTFLQHTPPQAIDIEIVLRFKVFLNVELLKLSELLQSSAFTAYINESALAEKSQIHASFCVVVFFLMYSATDSGFTPNLLCAVMLGIIFNMMFILKRF